MKANRILYVSAELTPYFPETPISRISLEAAKEMSSLGKDVRIFIPGFGSINERRHQLHEVIRLSGMNLIINDVDQPLIIKVASIPKMRLQAYFIYNEEYFKRKGVYGDKDGNFYPDNDERMLFFIRGVLETVKKLNWSPDIIHIHGWLSALLPLYVRTYYKDEPIFADTKIISSLYDRGCEGDLDPGMIRKIAMDGIDTAHFDYIQTPSFLNLTRLMIDYSDGVIKGTESLPDSVNALLNHTDKPVLGYLNPGEFSEVYHKFCREAVFK